MYDSAQGDTSQTATVVVAVRSEGGGYREYSFQGPFTIGRTEDCDVRIQNEFVSRTHVSVALEGGEWWLPMNPKDRNFWQLLQKHRAQIPQQTYDYVFYIFSAAVIGENPRLFGFHFDDPLAKVGTQAAERFAPAGRVSRVRLRRRGAVRVSGRVAGE